MRVKRKYKTYSAEQLVRDALRTAIEDSVPERYPTHLIERSIERIEHELYTRFTTKGGTWK